MHAVCHGTGSWIGYFHWAHIHIWKYCNHVVAQLLHFQVTELVDSISDFVLLPP